MSNGTGSGSPKISSVICQFIEAASTRLQIASLEMSVAKDNMAKVLVNSILAAIFGLFALTFISVALLVVFWDEHRIFVSCALAAFYLVVFLFFIGRARGLASDMPYAFEQTKQILAADAQSLKAAMSKDDASQKASAPQSSEEVNDAGK